MARPMKAILVTAFVSYEPRLRLVKNALESLGVTCQVLTTDFDHRAKAHRTTIPAGFIALPTRPYASNISLSRILSHRDFSRKAFAAIEKEKPDLLYVLVPPNSLADKAAHYKARHPDVKLILDVCDLWPEALPRPILKKALFPAMAFWQALRDRSLAKADGVFTECDFFRDQLAFPKAETVYWATRDAGRPGTPDLSDEQMDLAYLGSINNILSIGACEELISQLALHIPVTVHVIGAGERKEAFLAALQKAGARVVDYGPLYDEEQKRAVFSRCRFGLNLLRPGVAVGLTMKSVDYLKAGLPLINNLPGDTARFVQRKGVGLNTPPATACDVLAMTRAELLAARTRARALFERFFSESAVIARVTSLLTQILTGGGKRSFSALCGGISRKFCVAVG